MRKLSELAGRELRWEKAPRASGGGYALRDGDDTAATVRFRSSWGSFATAESADGCWTFKRVGFLQTRATIRPCGSGDEIASFKNNTWSQGGTLELPGGQRLQADTNLWMIGGLLSYSSNVEILPAGAAFTDAPWLVLP